MNATIKANMRSEISRTIMISNNLSHCSYKYTYTWQSMCPDLSSANAVAVVITKVEAKCYEGWRIET